MPPKIFVSKLDAWQDYASFRVRPAAGIGGRAHGGGLSSESQPPNQNAATAGKVRNMARISSRSEVVEGGRRFTLSAIVSATKMLISVDESLPPAT